MKTSLPKDSYGYFPQSDIEYTMDTLLDLWKERETITKEQILEHLEELLIDLDLMD
jgi:hypothetical protein